MDIGKIPPNDIEAEQAVIGSMLTDKDAVIAAIEVLKPEDFYREDNKTIYTAILNLYNRAEPVDIITLKDELSSMGKFNSVEISFEVIDPNIFPFSPAFTLIVNNISDNCFFTFSAFSFSCSFLKFTESCLPFNFDIFSVFASTASFLGNKKFLA